MENLVPWLFASSAAIIGLLGLVHLIYTFVGSRPQPRDPKLIALMQSVPLRITPHTSTWNAWIGFNASHSLAALLFALVYGYLALFRFDVLSSSPFLLWTGLLMLLSLLLIGLRYWFRAPNAGIALASACYAAGMLI